MKQALWIGIVALLGGCAAGAGQSGKGVREAGALIDFEQMETGKPPAGFATAVTGPGAAGEWFVRQDPTALSGTKVLIQLNADPTNARFPLAILEDYQAKDLAVTVAFKPISGKVDQAAGIIVRYKDKDNYYIARANGLEDNVRLYKVENGRRKQFAGAEKVTPPPTGTWHTLSLTVVGNRFEVAMDGKKLFEATDDTFPDPGAVGLWTKADSIIQFDDLRIVEK